MKKIIIAILGGIMTGVSFTACTNLDETLFSEIGEENISGDELVYMLAPIYGQYRWLTEWRSAWDMCEESTDTWVTPTNSDGGWYDGGIYQRLHVHDWEIYDPHFDDVWNHLYYGVSTSNRVLYQIESMGELTDEHHRIIAEIKVCRAYYYYLLCSWFGNVPITDRHDVPDDFLPETSPRDKVLGFVISEVKENGDLLGEDPVFGRFNKWSAKHLLAKCYINSQAWIGVDRYADCLEVCQEIIDSGKYELDTRYANIFSLDNETSKEILLAMPNDEKNGVPVLFVCYSKTRHWLNGASFNATAAGYNGLRAVPSFIDTYSPNDGRVADTYAFGQQYDRNTGQPIMFVDEVTPMIYTKEILSFTSAGEFDGYRFGKYEIKIGQINETDQNWVAFRYGETLMMKAECLLRSGRADEAAAIVNEVRARNFAPTVPVAEREYTGAQLQAVAECAGVLVPYGEFLSELGREFAGEMLRREQLLRWDIFTRGSWTFHEPSQSAHLNLFPIPESQRQANPKLKQNDGY